MGYKLRLIAALALIASLFATTLSAAAQDDPPYDVHGYEFHEPEFYDVWERTDRPVDEGDTARSWVWGPLANTPLIQEPYEEAPGGMRDVQYSDKSRMEMPWNGGDPDSPWFITQGLVAREMMTGQVQIGDDEFFDASPYGGQVAGDPDAQGPTYADMGMHLNSPARADGNTITDFMHSSGAVESLQHLAIYGVTDVDGSWQDVDGIDQPIASVFWDFMTSSGPIYENDVLQTGQIFQSPFYAIGYPLTPAYWSWVKVNNVEQNVLIQCFERRCLTFTPDNAPEWQVESGNIGQHYFDWRYNQVGDLDPTPPADPPEIDSFSVSPTSATNAIGDEHEITVSVEDQYGDPWEGAAVSASVTDGPHVGTDLDPDDATSGADGNATLSYTGTDEGTDTITVSVDGIDGDQTVTKTWAEYSLNLDPADATNTVGTTHEVEISVEDSEDAQVDIGSTDDVDVTIDREYLIDEGPDIIDHDYSLEGGVVTLSYDGPDEPATDTIEVTVTVDGIELNGTATKTWALPILTLDPETDDNLIGTTHEIDASVEEHDATPVDIAADTDVAVSVSRDFDDENTTDIELDEDAAEVSVSVTEGVATISIDGPNEPATDTIEVTVTVDGIDVAATATKTWVGHDLELSPLDDENPVITSHTVTATATGPDGDVAIDATSQVSVAIERVFDNGDPDENLDESDVNLSINGSGAAVIEYTGPQATAVDTIEITVNFDGYEATSSTTKTWVPGPPDNLSLTIDPDSGVSVDDTVTLTALVEDAFGNPVSDVDVLFESDPASTSEVTLDTVPTNDDGEAIITGHNHTVAEDEVITATEQENSNADSDTINWEAGAAAQIEVDLWFDHPNQKQSEINALGDRHHVVANVTDQYDNPVENESVTFSLSTGDPNDPVTSLAEYGTFDPDDPAPGTTIVQDTVGDTNSVGNLGFLYEGENLGDDVILAELTNNNSVSDTSDKQWCNAVVEDTESIQDAVNAADDGDTICVLEGTYPEHVTVSTDNLTILGANVGVDPRDGTRTNEATVGDTSGAFTLEANNVVVDGFELTNATAGGDTAAIVTSEGNSGYQILNNHIHGNELGVRLRSEGTNQSLVSTNFFEDNDVANDGVAKGLNTGFGPGRMLSNAVIEDNLFTGHWDGADSYSIHLINNPTPDYTGIEISRNVVHSSIVLIDVDGLTVDDNEVNMEFDTDSTSAMLVGGGVDNATISGNTLKNAGRGLGIYTFFSSGNGSITVTGNQIIDNTFGVQVDDDVSGFAINNNSIAGNGDGVENSGTGVLDATENWWGAADGPSGDGPGSGDSVSSNVDFSNFLTSDPF